MGKIKTAFLKGFLSYRAHRRSRLDEEKYTQEKPDDHLMKPFSFLAAITVTILTMWEFGIWGGVAIILGVLFIHYFVAPMD